MVHFLPQAPHQLWQTAASPFILPPQWQSMYQRCPRCGGSAPNVCNEVWPDRWWEDDMMGLMYQGHIPPSQRISPWEEYYAKSRVAYLPSATANPLRIDTGYHYHPHGVQAPMTPPQTPGIVSNFPYYPQQRPETPTSPTLPYSRQGTFGRQGTFNTISSFDSVHSAGGDSVVDIGIFPHLFPSLLTF